MRNIIVLLFIFFINFSYSQSQKIEQDSLEKICKTKPDSGKVIIINFWATWCKPCVHELPYFKEFYNNDSSNNYSLIFISFDSQKKQKELDKFISKNELIGLQFLAININFQTFFDNINPEWQGDIPLTIKITNTDIYYKFGSFENSNEFFHWIN